MHITSADSYRNSQPSALLAKPWLHSTNAEKKANTRQIRPICPADMKREMLSLVGCQIYWYQEVQTALKSKPEEQLFMVRECIRVCNSLQLETISTCPYLQCRMFTV